MSGGGGGGGSSTTVQSIPDELKPLASAYTSKAINLGNQSYTPYTGQRYANLNGTQNAAISAIQDRAINGSATLNNAESNLNSIISGDSSNPYLDQSVSKALDPDMDVKSVVEDHLEHVMRERLKKSFSPAHLASEAIEVQALVREAPGRLSDILGLLAENRLQVRMLGLDDSQLMENVQKVANRISTGIIVAALILASALLMRIDAGPRLLGYPALALVLFLVGAVLGLAIVASALMNDRKAKPRETHGPR